MKRKAALQGLSLIMTIALLIGLGILLVIFRKDLMDWAQSLLAGIFG